MNTYKPRKIEFQEVIQVGEWQVKVYTISKTGAFNHPDLYQRAIAQLSSWLKEENSFNAAHDGMAFLILHAGTEGVFSLINWWVGMHMLNTNIYLTTPESPDTFEKISGDGLGPCIWELEIINHERVSWTRHVIQKTPSPGYTDYLSDTVSLEL